MCLCCVSQHILFSDGRLFDLLKLFVSVWCVSLFTLTVATLQIAAVSLGSCGCPAGSHGNPPAREPLAAWCRSRGMAGRTACPLVFLSVCLAGNASLAGKLQISWPFGMVNTVFKLWHWRHTDSSLVWHQWGSNLAKQSVFQNLIYAGCLLIYTSV